MSALGLDADLLALDSHLPFLDRVVSSMHRKYRHPEAVLRHLGLDDTLLDNPNTEQNQMDADQVIEGLKAAIADMDPTEQDKLMELLAAMVADGDAEQAAATVAPSAQDRRRIAQDARLARHFNSPHVRAIEHQLSAASTGAASFNAMFPQAARIGRA
jgi:quinol monooxygenase YgiN